MKTARIVYSIYLDDNKNIVLGGAENYLRYLSNILIEKDYSVVIYQYAKKEFSIELDRVSIVGVDSAKTPKNIISYIDQHEHNYDKDLLIFGTDFLICKNPFKHSIAIQHGVAWDITLQNKVKDIVNYIWVLKSTLRTIRKYNRYKNCSHMICVDYNFLNWYRTQVAHIDMKCYCVPNFTQLRDYKQRDTDRISIIFARRFVEYRGTKLFTNSIVNILNKYRNIDITIAGTGPDEEWMRNKLKEYSNVSFITFGAKDSLDIHSCHDIAVVPTIGSEGTSLSLLEAMASGCAVIATNVGGMTNIVLDGYNGLLVSPDENDITAALTKLIENSEERANLSAKALETVTVSFSYEKWRSNWYSVIDKVIRDEK